jgi:broad specificity phosphatase PhoE
MLHLVLIRPGSTNYDVQERIQGSLDIPLDERGLAEVAEAVTLLGGQGLEIVYTPVSLPSLETAKILVKALGIKIKKLDRLQNLHMGLWEGMLIDDIRRKQPKAYRQWQEQPEIVCPPEGEMLGEADDRVRAAMAKIFKRHKEGAVGLVLPEPLLSLARRFLTRGALGDLWKMGNGHGRFEAFDVDVEEVLSAGVA